MNTDMLHSSRGKNMKIMYSCSGSSIQIECNPLNYNLPWSPETLWLYTRSRIPRRGRDLHLEEQSNTDVTPVAGVVNFMDSYM